jgi:peptidoglycan/xylan/chitin deacetylase (PgdA/CDA1 family)
VLRAHIKNAVARTVSWTGLDMIARKRRHRNVPFVVCYHRVVDRLDANAGFALPAMEISVATLERHLDWLEHHFQIISLDDLDARLEEPAASKPLAAVTFDDGYSDVFHHAFPLLKRKGIPAGVFVVTDLVGSDDLPIHERLHALIAGASRQWTSVSAGVIDVLRKADVQLSVPDANLDAYSATRFLLEGLPQNELLRVIRRLETVAEISEALRVALRPLTWRMITEMRAAGMTIGSHTRTHPFLTNESEEYALEQLQGSRNELEQQLGEPTSCFAYPDGRFDAGVVDGVAAAGYRYAFSICRHRDSRRPMLTIPRAGMWERSCLDTAGRFSPAIMSCCASGLFKGVSRCAQTHA